MSMRRRLGKADGKGVLQESLLEEEEQEKVTAYQPAPGAAVGDASLQRALIVYTPFSVEVFLRFILQQWFSLLRNLGGSVVGLLGWPQAAELTLQQSERLEDIKQQLKVPYSSADPAHQDALRQLWALAFPGVPCNSLKSPQWKEMGWQGEDPATDFRGAGLFGLDNLLYLGRNHPSTFQQLLTKSNGQRSDWEYPFAVAGLNLTFVLAELMDLHGSAAQPKTPAGRAFMVLLAEQENAFEEVYCAAFAHLDEVWLYKRASYMEFNAVMREVRNSLDAALRRRPASLQQLRASLRPPA